MKKMILFLLIAAGTAFLVQANAEEFIRTQMMRDGMRAGMMGGAVPSVPEKLTAPQSEEWVGTLRKVLAMERLSFDQYMADSGKYDAAMPYRMVIPQEEEHIQAITKLFAAYGLPADGEPGPIVETKTITEAYRLCVKMEKELIPIYESLVSKAEDGDTAAVLDALLLQTRHHLAMFEHALGRGGGMGHGMMGR